MIVKQTINAIANGEIFIVPNRAFTLGECTPSAVEDDRVIYNSLCYLNNFDGITDQDKLVYTWILSEDLNTKNLADHGGTFTMWGEQVRIGSGQLIDILPLKILEHHNEGDYVTIHFPQIDVDLVNSEGSTEAGARTLDLTLVCRCCQKQHRYSNLGHFENALSYVTREQ